ncbi:MAG: hypothetical protein J1E95_08135 [Muribaculaceae bacterium]|nr:hypothetical protein [Muribaculaceae bacterium]
MEYPFASNQKGYAVFENKNGVLTAYNNFMETEARFIPTEEYSYYPPTELSKPMQITAFNRAGIQTQEDTPENLQGKLVNGVVYNNSVYLGGLFGNSDNVWLKGDIVGDKVIFKNGSPYGITGLYLSTCYYEKGNSAYNGKLIPANEDLVFSYSESDGEPYLYEPSVGFTVTQNPGELDTWGFWNNIYFGSEISRFYDVAMTPQVPTGINYSERNCALSFCISNISEDGEVMDPNRLFYRIFINDELYVLKIQGKDVAEIPYSYPSDAGGFVDGYREIPFEMLSTLNLKIEMDMVYYGGGVKTYSPGSIGEAKIENLNAEEYNNQNVYDIYGRKVTDGDLKPGLYIRNGKKIIVR